MSPRLDNNPVSGAEAQVDFGFETWFVVNPISTTVFLLKVC